MKLTSLAIAATLIGSAIPAHATDWWIPNYQLGQCQDAQLTPDRAYHTLVANGYPDASLSDLGGCCTLWLTANHSNNVIFFRDRADCDGLAKGMANYNKKFN